MSLPPRGAATRVDVYELRGIAQRLALRGDAGISALVYYAAELAERRVRVDPARIREAIRATAIGDQP